MRNLRRSTPLGTSGTSASGTTAAGARFAAATVPSSSSRCSAGILACRATFLSPPGNSPAAGRACAGRPNRFYVGGCTGYLGYGDPGGLHHFRHGVGRHAFGFLSEDHPALLGQVVRSDPVAAAHLFGGDQVG